MEGDVCVNWNLLMWKIEAPPLILEAEKHPATVWVWEQTSPLFPSFVSFCFIWISLLLVSVLSQTAATPGGWGGRLRSLAEIIDNPAADLTVNQLIPEGARGLKRKRSFPLRSLFVSFPFCFCFTYSSPASNVGILNFQTFHKTYSNPSTKIFCFFLKSEEERLIKTLEFLGQRWPELNLRNSERMLQRNIKSCRFEQCFFLLPEVKTELNKSPSVPWLNELKPFW